MKTFERWEFGNADFYNLMKRLQERERQTKMSSYAQAPERPEVKPESKMLRNAGLGLVIFAAAYFTIHMVIWVVR